MAQITLDWEDEYASVLTEKDGRCFEIGTVVLKTLAYAIVGCTYYHHVLPVSDGTKFSKSRKVQYTRAKEVIASLERDHPEISVKNLRIDDARNPHFFDLAIPLKFTVPLLFSDPYQAQVSTKIHPYTQLLAPVYNLEVRGRVVHGCDMARGQESS
jgi:hypothetical protein